MAVKKKIIIPSAYFCSWNGGVKLVKTILDSLIDFDKKKHFDYILLVPDRNLISFIKRIYHFFKQFFIGIIYGKIIFRDWKYYLSAKELRTYFKNVKNLSIIGVDYVNEKNFLSEGINLLSMNLIYNKFKIGYLFDFQHKYYPKFFSKEVISFRNKFFKDILNSNDHIIVNSQQTKKDIFKFIKKFRSKIFVLPFAPYLDFNLNDIKKEDFGTYFVICNQFWKHKNFETAIKAMQYLRNYNCKLYITGQVDLKTNYIYFLKIKKLIKNLNLEDKVKFLGNLEKKDQLSIILNSVALIQPSLYEGGPGGFSVYEALSMNKNVLVTNINVNKEIKSNKVFFFKKQSSQDLYKKMIKVLKIKNQSYDRNKIKNKSKINRLKLGRETFKFLKKIEYS